MIWVSVKPLFFIGISSFILPRKILLPHPLNHGEDYPIRSPLHAKRRPCRSTSSSSGTPSLTEPSRKRCSRPGGSAYRPAPSRFRKFVSMGASWTSGRWGRAGYPLIRRLPAPAATGRRMRSLRRRCIGAPIACRTGATGCEPVPSMPAATGRESPPRVRRRICRCYGPRQSSLSVSSGRSRAAVRPTDSIQRTRSTS